MAAGFYDLAALAWGWKSAPGAAVVTATGITWPTRLARGPSEEDTPLRRGPSGTDTPLRRGPSETDTPLRRAPT